MTNELTRTVEAPRELPHAGAPHPTRRTFVRGAAASAAAAAATTSGLLAQGTRAGTAGAFGSAVRDPEMALLSRASFGYTTASAAAIRAAGYDAWLDAQLDPASIPDPDLDARLAAFDWIDMTADEMQDHPTLSPWEIAHEGRAVRLLRATYSERQLFERVVEFWTDHFNIYGSDGDTDTLKMVDDREVIRRHALGRFRDMLHASAKSPAMLSYLDNDTNRVGAPQENYAREVMELHTLGVDGPYTEQDVRELARCFTGWTYTPAWQSGPFGLFRFRPEHHDTGPKTVLGVQIPAGGGIEDAETILDVLASHPSTRRFVSAKLARWLLGYEPPRELLDLAASRWAATDGDIREVVRALLSRRALEYADPWRAPKLKRPFHWIVSVYRASGVDLINPTSTVWAIYGLGQVPFQWPAPNGYPDVAAAWAANLLPRWNNSAMFSAGWYWSTDHDVDDLRALLGGAPKRDFARRINEVIAGGGLHPRDVAEVQAHVDGFSNATDQCVAEAFELFFSSPSFNRY